MTENISIINRVAIGDVLRRSARKYRDKIAIVDGENRYSYQDIYRDTNQFANYLLAEGYQKGDAVATICLNSYEHIVAMYGIQKAALTWVPVNAAITSTEIAYILKETKAALIVVDAILYQAHESILKDYKCLISPKVDADHCFTKAYKSGSTAEPDVEIAERDIAQIMFTSGTTSNPKGVCISHLAVQMSGMGNCIELALTPSMAMIGVMPFFHCAQHCFLQTVFLIGGKLVVAQKFDPEHFMQTVDEEKINFVFLLPMMYKAILYNPARAKYDLSSLEHCLYAMAPMDQTTLRKGIEELDAHFFLATGQTEMYPATIIFKSEYQLTKLGSYWGEPSLINDVAILDEEGNELEQGMIGEIVHRGANVMSHYLNNPEITAEIRKFGWHHTGDLGYVDEDGLIVFVDRKKDMIKTGGENVASIHIEQKLLNCEHIENAVVVGLPHPHWIEAVTAFVILKEGATEEQVIAYCRETLASFQVPKKIVVVQEFPMTSTGKIQKQKLRAANVDLFADYAL